jgi:hypothetical protein
MQAVSHSDTESKEPMKRVVLVFPSHATLGALLYPQWQDISLQLSFPMKAAAEPQSSSISAARHATPRSILGSNGRGNGRSKKRAGAAGCGAPAYRRQIAPSQREAS